MTKKNDSRISRRSAIFPPVSTSAHRDRAPRCLTLHLCPSRLAASGRVLPPRLFSLEL